MAVEIKELVIRAVVNYSSSDDEKGRDSFYEQTEQEETKQAAIVDACVKQVLKIIERKQQR